MWTEGSGSVTFSVLPNLKVKVAQSRLTLCHPVDYTGHGILQARILECSVSLLQGIFPAQGSNPGLPHWRQILYELSHKGSPNLEFCSSVKYFSGEDISMKVRGLYPSPPADRGAVLLPTPPALSCSLSTAPWSPFKWMDNPPSCLLHSLSSSQWSSLTFSRLTSAQGPA